MKFLRISKKVSEFFKTEKDIIFVSTLMQNYHIDPTSVKFSPKISKKCQFPPKPLILDHSWRHGGKMNKDPNMGDKFLKFLGAASYPQLNSSFGITGRLGVTRDGFKNSRLRGRRAFTFRKYWGAAPKPKIFWGMPLVGLGD